MRRRDMSLHWRNDRRDSSGSVDGTKIGLGAVAATLGQAVKGELQVRKGMRGGSVNN